MIIHFDEYSEEVAVLLIRLMLGILFVIQGYDKLVNIGLKETAIVYEREIHIKFLPKWAYTATAVYSCYVEFFGGFLLILGLFKNIALVFLGADLLLVALAMGMLNPVWDMKFVMPRFLLLILLLILPDEWDFFSLDYYFVK